MGAIQKVYSKIQHFQDSLSEMSRTESHCKIGCSRCCYVELSVFEVEAENIRSWFKTLSKSETQELVKSWQVAPTYTENFHGDVVSACTFLKGEQCTIYEARPLICRTQGLALKFKLEQQDYVDICPLNETILEKIASHEILNLDLLNVILSQLEKEESKGMQRPRISLNSLKLELTREIENTSDI